MSEDNMLNDIEDARTMMKYHQEDDRESRDIETAIQEYTKITEDPTNAVQLILIGAELDQLYQENADHMADACISDANIEEIEAILTPAEGWAGGNDKARDACKLHTLGTNEALRAAKMENVLAQCGKIRTEGKINGLNARRRAIEWVIRAKSISDDADELTTDDLGF